MSEKTPSTSALPTSTSAGQQDDSLVSGFRVEDPAADAPLPQDLQFAPTDRTTFDRQDFVERLFAMFVAAEEELHWETEMPSRVRTFLGCDETKPTECHHPEPTQRAAGDQEGGGTTSPPDAALAVPPMPEPFESLPPGSKMYVVRDLLARCLGCTIADPLDVDFGSMAVTDVYLDLLHLAKQSGMTGLQVQQLLLLFKDTHADVSWMEDEADMATVAETLGRRLTRLSNPREAAVVETTVETVTVIEEKIDPVALAQFEQAKKEAKGKKAQQLNEATLPRIQVPVEVTKEVRTAKALEKSPVFSKAELYKILDFIQVTLLQHWRLYRFVLTKPRGEHITQFTIQHEDLAPQVTPLVEAITLQEYEHKTEREAMYDNYEALMTSEYDATIDRILSEFREQLEADGTSIRARWEQEQLEDKASKMTLEEYHRTVEVLMRRVTKQQAVAAAQAQQEQAAAAGGTAAEASIPAVTPRGEQDWFAATGKKLEKMEAILQAKQAETQPKGRK